ncbi:MAG: helix-turn-helix domain-containing protein [Nitrososphaerales archaeon]
MPSNAQFRIYNPEGLGQAVKHFREVAGLTQAELADRVDIQRSYLAELENGGVTEQTQRLVALFKALGVRITVGEADW